MDRGPLGMVLKMSRAVGLAPFTCSPEFKISRPLVIYGRILLFFNAILNYANTIRIILLWKYESVVSALHGIKVIGSIILTTANALGAFFAASRLMRMAKYFKKLDQIDKKLQKISRQDLKDKSNCKIPILIGGYIISLSTYIVADVNFNGNVTWSNIMINFIHIFGMYNIILLQLQIAYFAQRVNSTLIAINDDLEHLIFDDNCDTSATPNSPPEIIPHKIRDLGIFYGYICDIVKKNNEADGVITLLSVMFIALLIEMQGFVVCSSNMSNPSATYIFLYKVYPIFRALCYIFYLIHFIEQFHHTHCEMERTHNLINIGKSRKDGVRINHELELFFRMIVLSSVSYSPLDMCTLDRPLLVKLLSAMITYLVIMLQYAPETKSLFQYNDTITDSVKLSNSTFKEL